MNPDVSIVRRLGLIAGVIVAMLLLARLVWQMPWILLPLFARTALGFPLGLAIGLFTAGMTFIPNIGPVYAGAHLALRCSQWVAGCV